MRITKLLIPLLLVLALVPFIYVCFYAMPFADDYCAAWEAFQHATPWHNMANQYLYWNGRYTADALVSIHPLAYGYVAWLPYIFIASILITPVVFYIFIKSITRQHQASLIASLLVTITYFNYLPNITEGLYWYIGIANYHLGVMVLLLQLSLFVFMLQSGKLNWVLLPFSFLLLIIAIGFNEIAATVIPLFYLAAVIIGYQLKREAIKLSTAHLAVAAIAAGFVFFSPGNATRLHQFTDNYQLIHSIIYATAQTGRFVADWVISFPFLLLCLLCTYYSPVLRHYRIMQLDWRIVLGTALLVVFISAFIPYYATGILGQHRTLNYVYPLFILLWMLAVTIAANKHNTYYKFAPHAKQPSIPFTLVIFAGVFIGSVCTGNSSTIIDDYMAGNFAKYKTEYEKRDKYMLQHPQYAYPLPTITQTFTIVDAKVDTAWWADKCLTNYYREVSKHN